MPSFTTFWGESCDFTATLTTTSHTTISSDSSTIDIYTNDNSDIGTHNMVLTLSPDNYNDFVSDAVYTFDVVITSEICDAIVLI